MGQEAIDHIEGSQGIEGILENSWNLEGVEKTMDSLPPHSIQPVRPNEFFQDPKAPIGPEGYSGTDVPLGSEGIGGSKEGSEKIENAIGAGGKELDLAPPSTIEDFDFSKE